MNRILLSIALSTAATAAMAASPAADSVVTRLDRLELVRTENTVKNILEASRPVEPSQVPVPKFAVRTPDNSFVMSIGGMVNPIIGYDLGNDLYNAPGGGIDFTTNAIPVPPTVGNKSAFFINPLCAYLDFTIVGFGGTSNQLSAYIKLGTNQSNNSVLFKRAYISWRGLTAGLTQTNFEDGLACQPTTIDPEGPCGEIAATTYSIFYKSPSFSNFRVGAGIEMPSFYSSNGVYRGKDYSHEYGGEVVTRDVSSKMPDIPMYVEYAPSSQNRIRVSALLRSFFYRDLVDGRNRSTFGWGTQLSGNFSFYSPLTFNFQVVYGKGIGNYIQDIAGRTLSFTPDDSRPGRMTANPMMGLVFGASYNATSRLQFNAVGSVTRIWKVADYAVVDDSNNYKGACYVAANALYNLSQFLQVGIEYDYGRRYTWDIGSAGDNRILAQVQLTF